MSRPAVAVVLLAATLASITGCGISNPDATPPPKAATVAAPRRVAPAPTRSRPWDERALLERFAAAWITYRFATLPAQQRELAALATGALARQLHDNAEADLQAQYTRVASARSSGTVEAIVPRAAATSIVVTREQLTINGETQNAWNIYLAAVTDTPAGLRVATWTPASSG